MHGELCIRGIGHNERVIPTVVVSQETLPENIKHFTPCTKSITCRCWCFMPYVHWHITPCVLRVLPVLYQPLILIKLSRLMTIGQRTGKLLGLPYVYLFIYLFLLWLSMFLVNKRFAMCALYVLKFLRMCCLSIFSPPLMTSVIDFRLLILNT